MPQAGVSERPARSRQVETWLDSSEEDLWSSPRSRSPVTELEPVVARRTVTITGRGDDRRTPASRRSRPPRPVHERPGYHPDRVAAWAVVLGIVLILVAASSSRAATARPGHASTARTGHASTAAPAALTATAARR